MRKRHLVTRGVAAALLLIVWAPLVAQRRASERRVADPGGTQFNIQLLRPSGGPVIPIFEGWYQHPDGTYELTFGYFNVNTEEVLEIPIGSDNFIEPSQFDGRQPTHFLPVPEGDRRHWGVFTVTVPADFGDRDVVWTLRVRGQTLSVPGRVTRPPQLDGWIFTGETTASPVLRLEPGGPEGRGPWGVSSRRLEATVGRPLPLTVWTTRDQNFRDDTRPINVKWFKHQGPGDAIFSQPEVVIDSGAWAARSADGGQATTDVTFGHLDPRLEVANLAAAAHRALLHPGLGRLCDRLWRRAAGVCRRSCVPRGPFNPL